MTVEPLAVHPGELIREELDARNMSQAELGRLSGLSPKHINQILHGRSGIGTVAAHRLETALGITARTLIRAQADWDLANGRTRSRH